MDEKYYEKMYQANVKLVDENSTLKEYTKSLERRIDKAIEYIEKCGGMELINDYSLPEKPIIDKEAKTNLLEILKGDSYEQDNS